MDFGRITDDSVELAVALANSTDRGEELLPDVPALRELLASHGVTHDEPLDDGDVVAVRQVRQRLREVFAAGDADAAAALLNELVGQSGASPWVTDHDGAGWHLHFTAPGASLAERLAVVGGMALMHVLVEGGWERLGTCGARDCEDVFVDTTRNRSRQYCSQTCTTRQRVRAHRARQRRP